MNENFEDVALDSDNIESNNANKSFTSNDYYCSSKTTVLNVSDFVTKNRIKQTRSSSNENDDDYISSISFLLCVFDNIVGPKIVHYWRMDENETNLSDYLLKYIAIHTLNGELYLVNLKF